VVETLEAVPQVIASARALSGDRPLRLGLMSIGMRSNPYGAGVVPNPDGLRLPMAMDDPRQRTPFAAAFAVALAATCARGGVASFAPAMTGGPLGLADADGPWPLWHAVAALCALAGAEVTVAGGPAAGLVTIRGQGRRGIAGVAANLGPQDARLDGAVRIPDRAPPGWIDAPGPAGASPFPP
jgi:D-apionolactonase